MDSFENQIISAIKKIRNVNRRPDAEKIFSSKLRNTQHQGLDSYCPE